MNRRRLLTGSAALASLGVLPLIGCGDGGEKTPVTRTPAPATRRISRGGSIKVVWETEPAGSLDPHKLAGGFGRPMQAALFEGLMFKPAGKPAETLLAASMEQPDQVTFTFKLRPDITFHDGSLLDADLVKWNVERTLGKGRINDGGYKGASKGLAKIETPDAATVKFSFDTAKVDSAAAFQWTGQNSYGMVSRDAAERLGDGFDRNPVGTGPFRLKEWTTGSRMVFERFDGYWRKDASGEALPYLDELQFVDVPETNVAVLSLQSNQIQAVMIGPQEAQQLATDKNVETYRKLVPDLFIYLNHLKPPFDDIRLRKALAAAIRRDEVMKVAYFGQGEAFGGGYHPDGSWYDASFKGQTYDANVVRTNLQLAGAPSGFSFEMAVLPRGPRKAAAELMQAQLKEFGIRMELLLMESNDYTTKGLTQGELQAFFAGGGTEGLGESPTAIYTLIGPSSKMNPSPETAKVGLNLYNKIQTQFDVKERYKTFQDLAQWFWVDFVGRVDVGREAKIAAQRKEIGGFEWYSVSPQGTWNGAYRRA